MNVVLTAIDCSTGHPIFISTDNAVRPIPAMGGPKRRADILTHLQHAHSSLWHNPTAWDCARASFLSWE